MISLRKLINENSQNSLDQFVKGYISCALATSDTSYTYNHGERKKSWDPDYDEDAPSGEEEHEGEQMSKHYDADDIDPETLQEMIRDCKDFHNKYREFYDAAGWHDSLAGHDFWLTRNRHGSGFWDRTNLWSTELYHSGGKEALDKVRTILTDAAHSYGEYHLYLGDGPYDGYVCGSKG